MNKRKLKYQILLLVLTMSGTLYYLFHGDGLETFISTIRTADPKYLFLALCMLMAFILLESVIIKILFVSLDEPVNMRQCCKYSFVGFFFYCITPAGSGEQPAQLVAMHHDGIDSSKGVLVLGFITITFKAALVLLALLVYAIRPSAVMQSIASFNGLCVLGMILSVGTIVLLVWIIFVPKTALNVSIRVIKYLAKHSLIKDENEKIDLLTDFIGKYADAFSLCLRTPYTLFIVLLVSIIQRICLLAVTGLSCIACGISISEFPNLVLLQEMIHLSTEMLPLPGGMGVHEALYLIGFTPLVGKHTLATLIISRGISFYVQLITCGILSLIIYIRHIYRKGGR